MTPHSRRRGLATAATVALLTITTAACSSDGDASGGSGDSAPQSAPDAAVRGAEESPADGSAALDQAGFLAAESDAAGATKEAKSGGAQGALQQAVISTGNVAMKSGDVAQAIFDVRKVVDAHRGEVQEDSTETDDDGDPLRSRMVLRIPSGQFVEAMERLERVATLITSSSNSKDVTTAVIDKRVRIQVQKRSIARIAVLLDRAVSIRDIVNIEAELSRRQAELASLEKQQGFLADQTSMSTITVSVERTREAEKTEKKEDDDGFFAGLAAGWDGLTTFGVGLATVLGALLPWTIVLAILAIPGWPLLRRLRRRDTPPTAATA